MTLYFNVTNPELPNQIFYLNGSKNNSTFGNAVLTQAFDDIGTGYAPIRATLGISKSNLGAYNSLTSKLSTGNYPVLGTITFSNVLSNVTLLSKIDVCMGNKDEISNNYNEINRGVTEFNNVKIVWH